MFLGDPLGGQLGPQNRTEVVILKDEEDGKCSFRFLFLFFFSFNVVVVDEQVID